MPNEYRCANCGRVGLRHEAVNWRGWMLCRVPCEPLDKYPDELKAGPSPHTHGNSREAPTERSGADGGGSARSPGRGHLHSNDLSGLGLPAAPGLPPGFWRGPYLIALALSLPVWALIGWLIYVI